MDVLLIVRSITWRGSMTCHIYLHNTEIYAMCLPDGQLVELLNDIAQTTSSTNFVMQVIRTGMHLPGFEPGPTRVVIYPLWV